MLMFASRIKTGRGQESQPCMSTSPDIALVWDELHFQLWTMRWGELGMLVRKHSHIRSKPWQLHLLHTRTDNSWRSLEMR